MFVRGGIVIPGGSLSNAGYDGYYWSSVSDNSHLAYILYFGSSSVLPSSNEVRRNGFSLRCVALGD